MGARRSLLAFTLVAACAAVAGGAEARSPAYTMHAGFRTALEGVPEESRKEECLDLACREKGGVLVARGDTEHGPVKLGVRIREFRRVHDAGAQELEGLARKILAKGVDDRELRLVTGAVRDRAALEQWSLVNPCARQIGGRVLISLPDKVVEVEAIATAPLDTAAARQAVDDVARVLHGARIHRLGDDVVVDPAGAPPPANEVLDALAQAGCTL